MFCSQLAFSIWEALWSSFWSPFWVTFGLIWTLGYLGDSKWTSKGSWMMFWTLPKSRPRKTIEKVILRVPPGGTDFTGNLWAMAQVLDTSGPLGRVPACTGAHLRILLIFWSAEGRGSLKENPVFLKDLQEKERELERKRKNN